MSKKAKREVTTTKVQTKAHKRTKLVEAQEHKTSAVKKGGFCYEMCEPETGMGRLWVECDQLWIFLRALFALDDEEEDNMKEEDTDPFEPLDDDDEYLPERLEKLVEFAKANQCDFVWHPFWYNDQNGEWRLNQSQSFRHSHVTTSSVFYRSWFKRIEWDTESYRLREPGDWNRFRRIKYLNPVCMRFSEPLLRHYMERGQPS